MAKYLLFAGSDYNPNGGWGDYKGDFDSKFLALEHVVEMFRNVHSHTDWFQVVDNNALEVILAGDGIAQAVKLKKEIENE